MADHQPPGYVCPFCRLVAGGDGGVTGAQDVVRRTDEALAFVSPRWWPNNHGHVIVIPVEHHENLYDLPARLGHAVHDVVREVAVALRESYPCDGVSTRQHNEPAGGQDVWHFHTHVFPRYRDDDLYGTAPYPDFVSAADRLPYAQRLRDHFVQTGRPG